MKIITNRDIIITGLQSWDIEIGSNCKNIAAEFAKHNRVLYVNPPKDRFSLIKDRFKKNIPGRLNSNKTASGQVRKISDNLWVLDPDIIIESISQLPLNVLFDFLNVRNNIKFAREILKGIRKLNFKDYIHFCDSDMFRSFYLKEMLKPSLFIYYSRDNLQAVKYWETQGARIEPKLMTKSDLVLTNSLYLNEKALQYNQQSYFVGQGCDIKAFEPYKKRSLPSDLNGIVGPVIGYIGALNSLRLNIKLLEILAGSNPFWSFVFVGPEDLSFQNSRLHSLKNVHFLGPKHESELSDYLYFFDIAINPQNLNKVTIGNYPRKIDEYLAMGKPTVATKTKAMEYFHEFVLLANSPEEWENAIKTGLSKDSEKKRKSRIQFAGQHTWSNSTLEIYKQIIRSESNIRPSDNKLLSA
jgi:glycosyltransferase involved in cell wall biosynthesis